MKKIIGKIRKADKDYNLIDDNDVIAVGVSGGKDSMLALYAMSIYQKVCIRHLNKSFRLIGIHIDMGFKNMDFSEVDEFCKNNNIELHHIPSQLYEILSMHKTEEGRLQCSICSKLKKGAVINAAIELGCNKTCFAHHADDAIETLFLNMIYGGRIATFTPSMYLTNSKMNFIRPLVYCFENEINKAVIHNTIPIVKSTCPEDGFTKREDIKQLLHSIYHTYPGSKDNFLLMLHNKEKLDLWSKS